jgi:hypothetical protein
MAESGSKSIQNQHGNCELLPCPFCGSEAHFIKTSNISTHTGVGFVYIIACSKCKCTPIQKANEMYIQLDKDGELKITSASEIVRQNMIDEWNTRTPKERGAENG